MIKLKNRTKSLGYIHPVRELLMKANYEIIEKIAELSAPPYILILLHNAMELMLRDFFSIQKVVDCKDWSAIKLIEEAEKKISFVKNNKLKFKDLNTRRNQIYHKSTFTLRIENLIDDYRLITGLYEFIYKRRFIPDTPSRILISLVLLFYSVTIFFSMHPLGVKSLIGQILYYGSLLAAVITFYLIIKFIGREKDLCGYFPINPGMRKKKK